MDEAFAKFSKAVGFFEVPAPELRLGAFAVVVDPEGRLWGMEEEGPRPVSLEEVRGKGGFACKPEDAAELIPARGHRRA